MSTALTAIQDAFADWVLTYNEIVTDPTTVIALRAIPEDQRTDAQNALWISLNNTAIWLAENGVRPTTPHISMHMELVTKQGLTPYRDQPVAVDPLDPSKGVNVLVYYVEEIHLYLQSFGTGTNNNLQKVQQSLMKDSVLEFLASYGLAFHYDSGIQDIHTPLDLTYEERFSYDITFGIGQTIEDNVMNIETVEINQ